MAIELKFIPTKQTAMAEEAKETKAYIKIGFSLVCGLCAMGHGTVFHDPLLPPMFQINKHCTHHMSTL